MAAKTGFDAKVKTNSLIWLHETSLTWKHTYYVQLMPKYPLNNRCIHKCNMASKTGSRSGVWVLRNSKYGQFWFTKEENKAISYIWDIFIYEILCPFIDIF